MYYRFIIIIIDNLIIREWWIWIMDVSIENNKEYPLSYKLLTYVNYIIDGTCNM